MAENRRHVDAVVKTQTGMVVQVGPFKGMKILDRASWGDGDLTPKLLGVYEEELHPYLAQMKEKQYGAVVVVGCAEGFYAVGAARLFPEIPILAFDTNPGAIEIMMENAVINGCSDRIVPGQFCSGVDLVEAANRYTRLLIICDCEGYEIELLQSEQTISALSHSDLIVECHDFLDANCTPAVIGYLGKTHVVELVYCGGRNPNQFAFLSKFNDLDRWLAVNENRPCLMNWLVARSRNPRA